MLKFKLIKGQILVETIIGVGVIGIVLAAIIPLFLLGIKVSAEADKQEIARMLAQETLEQAKALKIENWNNLYHPLGTDNREESYPYHIVNNGGTWILAEGAEDLVLNNINFNRQLVINNVSRTGINGAGELETVFHSERLDPSTLKIRVLVSWPGSLGMELIDYFSRHQNSIWQQSDWQKESGTINWQDPPGNGYFSASQIDTTSGPGTLRLARIPGGNAQYGNRFIVNATTSIYRLNNPNYRVSLRFTLQNNGNINQLRIYVEAAKKGETIFYRYGLQEDDGNGFPKGNYLSSEIANFSTPGWQTINLTSPAAVLAGNVYHLVIQYDSGSQPSNSRYLEIRASSPNNQIIPQNSMIDLAANTLIFNGSAWNERNLEPIYVLGFEDGILEGNPYDSRERRPIYRDYFEGEKFFLDAERNIVGLGLYVAASNIDLPAGNLNVTLIDQTENTTLIDETFLTPEDLDTVFGWEEHQLDLPVNLPADHEFLLYFSSPDSNPGRNYLVLAESNPNLTDYNQLNWQGIQAMASRSSDGGGSFDDLNFVDLAYYLIVADSEVYAPWGELISATFDTNNPLGAGFHRVSWQALGNLPIGTEVKVQLAANNDQTTWNWAGPAGTGDPSDWYSLSTGENIWFDLCSKQYLRYKIRLETTDNTVTPVVDWIRINWSY